MLKRLLFAIICVVFPACATNTFGSFVTNASACFQSTPCTVTFPSLPSQAQIFVVGYIGTGSYTGFTVSDNVNGSYTCNPSVTTSGRLASGCHLLNSSASGSTVTVSLTPTGGSGNVGMDLGVWYYTSTSAMRLDVSVPANTGIASGNSFITPSITTLGSADLVVAWVWATDGASTAHPFAIDSSFTVHPTSGTTSEGAGEIMGASPGTYQPTFTNAGIAAGVGVTGIIALTNVTAASMSHHVRSN
ncbi:MAG TPA: hypothetical protein VHY84_27445 [Bryobacteraceae bacterium]|jgi:hypothetical protein|nr:hypothetical protein [Bryobacteraceae bacterium]